MKTKNFIKHLTLILCLVLSFSSCMTVQDALLNDAAARKAKNQPKPTASNHKKPSSAKPSDSKNTKPPAQNTGKQTANTTQSTVYTTSKDYLKKHPSVLTEYCMSWVGTPHVQGGMSKNGVDCSGFVSNVYKDVYGITLPRRSADMEKEVDLTVKQSQLKEGDLVFFGKNGVNHVGIYLQDNNFIHTSTSKGVIVSSLEEKYWKENYRSCGHHPKVNNKKHK